MIFPPAPKNIEKAAILLKNDGVVAFPTETVYGLGGLARSDKAIRKIYQTKGRPSYNPLIVHVDSLDQALSLGTFDRITLRVIEKFWPGPLTVVVPLKQPSLISVGATAGLDTVAIRLSNHPVLLSLLNLVGEPIVAPSANASGFLSPTKAQHVEKCFPSMFILEGGETEKGLESTVIRSYEDRVVILRPGTITKEHIETSLGIPVSVVTETPVIESPGQTLQHYSPTLPVRINVLSPLEGEAFLGFGQTKHKPVLNLSPEGCVVEAAHNLFSFLHMLDDPQEYRAIAVSPIPHTGVGVAINDRLRRASTP